MAPQRDEDEMERRLDESRRELARRVSERGWTAMFVSQEGHFPVTYTLGLSQYADHPDLAVTGLDPETALTCIADLADGVVRGTPVTPGRYGDIIEDFDLWVTPVPDDIAGALLHAANWWRAAHGGGGRARALQVVVPDPNGLFPPEPGCDPAYARLQVLLDPDAVVPPP